MRDGCPFCDYDGPSEILASYFDDSVFVIEPIEPVTWGHVLLVPRRHVEDFASDMETTREVFAAAALEMTAMRISTGWRQAEQANLITSAGELATQTVMHFHVHLVPRRKHDGLPLPWNRHRSAAEWLDAEIAREEALQADDDRFASGAASVLVERDWQIRQQRSEFRRLGLRADREALRRG